MGNNFKLINLVKKEMFYSRISVLLEMFSVMIAVIVFILVFSFLKIHDIRTKNILKEKEQKIKLQIFRMNKEYHKIAREYGYNIVVYSKDQNMNEFYDRGYTDTFISEDYINRLIECKELNIGMITAVLEEKIRWQEEMNRNIFVCGTSEMNLLKDREPIFDSVEASELELSSVSIGYELWNSLKLNKGDEIIILGNSFKVAKLFPQSGTKEDITVKMDLKASQKLLNKENLVNEIKITNLYTSDFDFRFLEKIIKKMLPDIQIIEMGNKASTMKESLNRAQEASKISLDELKNDRQNMRDKIIYFAGWIIPLVLIAVLSAVLLLTVNNLRSRQKEVAVLRVLGTKTEQIYFIFFSKIFIISFIGAVLGIILSFLILILMSNGVTVFKSEIFMLTEVLVGIVLVTTAAGLLPVAFTVNKDPANILRDQR